MGSSAFQLLTTVDEWSRHRIDYPLILLSAFGEGCPVCLQDAAEERIARAGPPELWRVKFRVDDLPGLADMLDIDLIPTLLLFDGPVASRFTGIPSSDGQNVIDWLLRRLPAAPKPRRPHGSKQAPR